VAKKILIVDDEPHIVRLLASRLRADNYEVRVACDGYQCIKVAREERPDLIILDIKMPAGGGLHAFETLRALPDTILTPVIFITAYASEEIRKQVLEMGAEDFITKPFDSDDLMRKVRKALGDEPETFKDLGKN
jgi:DNA-binding response OmpR family regulator